MRVGNPHALAEIDRDARLQVEHPRILVDAVAVLEGVAVEEDVAHHQAAFGADEVIQAEPIARVIGRAHVCTPVTNARLVCRLLLENKKQAVNIHNTNTHLHHTHTKTQNTYLEHHSAIN